MEFSNELSREVTMELPAEFSKKLSLKFMYTGIAKAKLKEITK